MIKKLIILDGVIAVAHFRDDGVLVDGYGLENQQQLDGLAHFAHDYKRIVQGNADQLAMFTQVAGFTPPGGWIVRGDKVVICSTGNLVCMVSDEDGNLNEVMQQMLEIARS